MTGRFGWHARWLLVGLSAAMSAWLGCTAKSVTQGRGTAGAASCTPGETAMCACPTGEQLSQACAPDGKSFLPCPCPAPSGIAGSGNTGAAGSGATSTGTAGAAGTTTAGASGLAGTGGAAGTAQAGAGGRAGTGGTSGQSGASGAGGTAGSAGAGGTGSLDSLRQVCVDTINMYRATKSLSALKRPSATIETCSDAGAKKDGDSGQAHGSAGSCPGFGGQDTCPGWTVGGFSGVATVADALKMCLQQMWAEGEPPVSRDACIQDYQNCYLKHGHYMNMTGASTAVSCGFYQMTNGNWWMNQDFN